MKRASSTFHSRDRVSHPEYGLGFIERTEEDNAGRYFHLAFADAQEVWRDDDPRFNCLLLEGGWV